MKKAEIKKLMWYEKNDAGEIAMFKIFPKNEDMEVVNVFAKPNAVPVQQAVYAGLDTLRHNLYDHPLTTIGLHMNVDKGITQRFSEKNVGAVSVNYKKSAEFQLVPDGKFFPHGWAIVNIENAIYTLDQPDNPITFTRKHNFIDGIMLGVGFNIYVPAYLRRITKKDSNQLIPWAEAMANQLEETDDVKAKQDRDDRIGRYYDQQYLNQPFVAASRRGEQITRQDVGSVGPETELTMVDGTKVQLGDLEQRPYLVYKGNRVSDVLDWDGSIDNMALIAQIVKGEFKLKVKA